jgi:hypothetical protein
VRHDRHRPAPTRDEGRSALPENNSPSITPIDESRKARGRNNNDATGFREIGFGSRNGAGNHAGIGRQRLRLGARGRFTIAAQIGLEQITLGRRFALERAQFDRLLALARRPGLER